MTVEEQLQLSEEEDEEEEEDAGAVEDPGDADWSPEETNWVPQVQFMTPDTF